MGPLPSRVIGVTLSSVAFLLTVGSYLGQPKSPASELEIAFSTLEEIPAQSSDRSIQAFRSALVLDPASPFRWCDLGEAYLLGGDMEKARVCYLRGSALGPRMPPVQLRLCNFQIRTGDLSNAAVCLAELLSTAPAYRQMIFSYYDRLGFSPEQFAGKIDSAGAAALVQHLLQKKKFDDAVALWRLMSPAKLLGNGDFEEPIGEGAFNWNVEGTGTERDSEGAFSGKWSLKIRGSSGSVSQTIFLSPGVYKLELFTQSDDGRNRPSVQVSLEDLEDAARFSFHSTPFETISTWRAVACTFTVPARTRLLALRVEAAKTLAPAAVRLDKISIAPAGSKAP
jgi:tetratricopeptide (TPR) repeat protein